jgi:hypothetical protein
MNSLLVDHLRSVAGCARAARKRSLRNRRRSFAGRVIEALEGRVLLHANAVEDAEHVEVFGSHYLGPGNGPGGIMPGTITGGLVPNSSMTDVSVQNGSWTDANTWSNGVPTNYANVLITAGTTVTINSDVSSGGSVAIHALRIDGTLRFNPTLPSTTALSSGPNPTGATVTQPVQGWLTEKLLVDTIIVESAWTQHNVDGSTTAVPGGTLNIGDPAVYDSNGNLITPAVPVDPHIQVDIEFADNGPVSSTAPAAWSNYTTSNAAWDPYQFSRGLISHGTVNIAGAEVQSYVSVPSLARGTTQIVLSSHPTGWQAGDQLVITGTTPMSSSGASQDENASIVSMTDNYNSTTGAYVNTTVVFSVNPTPTSTASSAGTTTTAVVTAPTGSTTATTSTPVGLVYNHIAPSGDSIYVSDVTRNIDFRSQNYTSIMDRGHTMFMHYDGVHIDAAGFYGLGRTDKADPIDDVTVSVDTPYMTLLQTQPNAPLPPGDFYQTVTDPTTGITTTTTTVMTTNVIDQKTGQYVMVPVLDASGKPIPLYSLNGSQVPVPAGTAVPQGATPLYQTDAATGNPLPQLDQSGNPITVNGVVQYIPLYETQVARTGLNPRGRYAVHFHRTGIDPADTPVTINDSAVVDTVGWGIVNHSSDVNATNNVVYNATGAAFVTEAGDEIGSFVDNLAISSRGGGGSAQGRPNVQDFGQEGVGFWLQGGDVALIGNAATGQHGSGYVYFPVGLNQAGLGVTQIPYANLTPQVQAALYAASPSIKKAVDAYNTAIANNTTPAPAPVLVPDGDVPLLKFDGNTAYGDGDPVETWFSLLDFTGNSAVIGGTSALQTVVSNFNVWNSGGGIFDPYTNSLKFDHVTILGNLAYPGGTAFNRNDVTANVTYHDVNAKGFSIGINVPVNGTNNVIGGTFDNLKNIYITTANDKNRVVNIDDGTNPDGSPDRLQFPDDLVSTSTVTTKTTVTTTVNGQTTTTTKTTNTTVVTQRQQYDIYLQTNYNPKLLDITTFFNPDVIKLGTVLFNGQQVYYYEQAADYIPFPSVIPSGADPTKYGPIAASYIPAALLDLTNGQLWQQFGLSIGGVLAPATTGPNATGTTNSKVYGILGPAAAYLTPLQLLSAKYTEYNTMMPDYILKYRYWDPNHVSTDAKTLGQVIPAWVTVTETVPRQLQEGWNLLTINPPTDGGQTRTLLVYGDDTPPTFTLDTSASPLVINVADVNNGSIYTVKGQIVDASFGTKLFQASFALNDPTHVFPAYVTLPDGTTAVDPNHILLEFTITDLAKNPYKVIITLTVTTDATLLRDLGQKAITTVVPSTTLLNVIQVIDMRAQTPIIMGVVDPTKQTTTP